MSKPKIVLVFPSPVSEGEGVAMFPLSVLSVASPLFHEGYRVVVLDERLENNFETRLLEEAEDALCVGVSTITGYQLKGAVNCSRKLKEHFPSLPVVWGGYHPSLYPEQVVAEDYVDIAVSGQGEVTFSELVKRLEKGDNLENLPGVTYVNGAGEIVSNPNREMEDLDKFPPVNYELFDIEKLFELNGSRGIQYVSSQGCFFKCSFCADATVFGTWKAKSAETVVADLQDLKRRFNMDHITFVDANFFAKPRRAGRICELFLEKGLDISWSGSARADQLVRFDKDYADNVRRAGCIKIGVGMESGSKQILDLIEKRIDPEIAEASNRVLANAGINGLYTFIVGFPKELPESQDEIMQTLRLIKRLRKDYPEISTLVFLITPYPGTPFFKLAQKLNIQLPQNTEEWVKWEHNSDCKDWVTKKENELIECCNDFYFPLAYPGDRVRRQMRRIAFVPIIYPFHWLALLRCRFDFYKLPFEWHITRFLTHLMGKDWPTQLKVINASKE